jgi:hypothetical protein
MCVNSFYDIKSTEEPPSIFPSALIGKPQLYPIFFVVTEMPEVYGRDPQTYTGLDSSDTCKLIHPIKEKTTKETIE